MALRYFFSRSCLINHSPICSPRTNPIIAAASASIFFTPKLFLDLVLCTGEVLCGPCVIHTESIFLRDTFLCFDNVPRYRPHWIPAFRCLVERRWRFRVSSETKLRPQPFSLHTHFSFFMLITSKVFRKCDFSASCVCQGRASFEILERRRGT